MSLRKRLTFALIAVCLGCLIWALRGDRNSAGESVVERPAQIPRAGLPEDQVTLADVLNMARRARQQMTESLDDYTARFVKQEADSSGVLGERSEVLMKVQTRLRGDREDAPMRVYLKYQSPQSIQGREVVWAEDLNDGKLGVHENYFPLSLKTLWLDPYGMLAMQGEQYAISEIGLVRLVEKLIERGEKDLDNPDIEVTIERDHRFEDLPTELIQVKRAKPSGQEDDYSLAEIVIDPARQLVVRYRSFGWPAQPGADAPLQESYSYYDVQTNVGLTDKDFDPTNPDYTFP